MNMTFSSKVKKELCKSDVLEQTAELYGLLLFSKSFKFSNITFSTENSEIFEKVRTLISTEYGAILDVVSSPLNKKSTFILNIPFLQDRNKILKSMHHYENEINLRIHKESLNSDEKIRSFLRGTFLSCGTIVDPSISYHVELVVPYMNLANDLSQVISEMSSLKIKTGITVRKGIFIVYIKGNENIVDFLTYIGAPLSAMDVIQVKMLKEVRNYVNRTTNFETANLGKTTAAAAIQIESIKKIRASGILESLDEDLKELAKLRFENPDMSLRLLGENLSKPLTRSGVNHKMKKLLEIADNIK